MMLYISCLGLFMNASIDKRNKALLRKDD